METIEYEESIEHKKKILSKKTKRIKKKPHSDSKKQKRRQKKKISKPINREMEICYNIFNLLLQIVENDNEEIRLTHEETLLEIINKELPKNYFFLG